MRSVYAMDLECTTDIDDCRVWAWKTMNIFNFDETHQGIDIDSFHNWILKVSNCDGFFHNLRYDGWFLIDYLFRQGYSYDDSKTPKAKTFQTVITKNGQWYQLDITTKYTGNGKGKAKRHHVRIMDSRKKLPFSIKTIANTFGLTIAKGDIDYHKYRPIGYQLDSEEEFYLHNDVEILARALKIQYEQDLDDMTIGMSALSNFKDTINGRFDKYFPKLDAIVDEFLRPSYKGGFTWCNPKKQGLIIPGGLVYDINSLYPSVMDCVFGEWLPWGEPIRFEGQYQYDETHPLYIVELWCEFELKDNHIPTIQIKQSRFKDNEYLKSSDNEQVKLTVTNVDLELIVEHYNVYNVKWGVGYKFKKANKFFNKYISYWNNIKEENSDNDGNPGLRTLSKLMLNNLYGKFGKNPDITKKYPELDKDKNRLVLRTKKDENGDTIKEIGETVYIPMASFITAYARRRTIQTAQKLYHRILYCDTDSIHLSGTELPKEIENEIDNRKLGYWKFEGEFVKGKFLRQKTYVEQYKKKKKFKKLKYTLNFIHTDIKCAGLPEKAKKKMRFEDFRIGYHDPTGRLIPKSVPGGQVLIEQPFTLK